MIIIINIMIITIVTISNSNWTEWSTIKVEIARVISKSDKREVRGRFKITSTISLFTVPKFAISQSEAESNVLISYDIKSLT